MYCEPVPHAGPRSAAPCAASSVATTYSQMFQLGGFDVLLVGRERPAHRKDQQRAVARDVDVLEVVERALGRREVTRAVMLTSLPPALVGFSRYRSACGRKVRAQAQIVLGRRRRDRRYGALDVDDAEVGGLRVGRLRVGDSHRAAAAVAAARREQHGGEQRRGWRQADGARILCSIFNPDAANRVTVFAPGSESALQSAAI